MKKSLHEIVLRTCGRGILTGGAGNDYLVGNAGNDVYVFNRGDGQDTGNAANDSEWRIAA